MEAPWRSMTNDSSWKVMEHETKTHFPSNQEFFLLGYFLCPMHFMWIMKSFSWQLQQLTKACDFQWCPFTWYAQPMSIMFDFGSPKFIASWAFVFGFFCLLAMSPILLAPCQLVQLCFTIHSEFTKLPMCWATLSCLVPFPAPCAKNVTCLALGALELLDD